MRRSVNLIHLNIAVLLAVAISHTALAEAPSTKAIDPARRQKALELLTRAESFPIPKGGTASMGGDLVEAHILLGELAQARHRLDQIGTEELWKFRPATILARAQLKAGDKAGAQATLASIPEPMNGSEEAFAELQAAAGDFAGAAKTAFTLSRIPEPGFQANALIALASEEFRAGKHDDSDRDFTQAAQAITHLDAWENDLLTSGDIAIQRDECGDHTGALRMLKADADADDARRATVSIALAHYIPADHDRLVDLLTQLQKALASDAAAKPEADHPLLPMIRVGRWDLLANGWILVGENTKAREAVAQEEKLLASFKDNPTTQTPLLEGVAMTLVRAGDRAGALERIDRAISAANTLRPDQKTSALWRIASTEACCTLAGDTPRVIQLAIKAGPVDSATGGSIEIAMAARQLAATQGPAVDLSWIESLPTDEEKAAALAGAAVGMLSVPTEKARE